MYDTRRRYCPKHPTLVHPCQICANPSSVVNPDSADNIVVNQVNWAIEAATPYNTPAPRSRRHDNMEHFAMREGLDSHWDDPQDIIPAPPIGFGGAGPSEGYILSETSSVQLSESSGAVLWP